MKKIILIIMLLSLISINASAQSSNILISGVKIEIFEDGKMTPNKMIADFFFYHEENKTWHGGWQHIYISPNDSSKDVILKIQSYSIDEGTIQNFQRFSDGCSFEMLVSEGRKYQVVIKENSLMPLLPKVTASALWYSPLLKEEIRTEWKSTDKLFFELPYNKVF
jgi:hypothetical protein